MDKMISLRCKNCNSELDKPTDGVFHCSWCGSSFVKEEYFSSPRNEDESDFIIVASIAQKYVGGATDVTVPAYITVIERNAFRGLSTIQTVVLPEGLEEIGDGAFEGCTGLRSIILPKSLKRIGCNAFRNSGIVGLTLHTGLSVIGESAFANCYELETLTLNSPLPQNCKNTFKNCRKLSVVNASREIFAPSFFVSVDINKLGDTRPTYADLFQGTEYYSKLNALYTSRKCIYCNSELNIVGKCNNCGTRFYGANRGCYIATCVYGSYDSPEVCILRRFRDRDLMHTPHGRAFIRLYYCVSPWLVKIFGRFTLFKKLFALPLGRLIRHLRKKGYSDTPYTDIL